jgi:aminomethyltransferase
MGYCLYGNDIDKTTNPLEAGLAWITKFDKGDFVGSAALRRVKAEGIKRMLVGFVLSDKAVPRHGYALQAEGQRVGVVTSGTFSPSLQQGIGMGYVQTGLGGEGTTIQVDIRGRLAPATIVKLPFLRK